MSRFNDVLVCNNKPSLRRCHPHLYYSVSGASVPDMVYKGARVLDSHPRQGDEASDEASGVALEELAD